MNKEICDACYSLGNDEKCEECEIRKSYDEPKEWSKMDFCDKFATIVNEVILPKWQRREE